MTREFFKNHIKITSQQISEISAGLVTWALGRLQKMARFGDASQRESGRLDVGPPIGDETVRFSSWFFWETLRMAHKNHVTKREDMGRWSTMNFLGLQYPVSSVSRQSATTLCCVPQVVAQLKMKNFLIWFFQATCCPSFPTKDWKCSTFGVQASKDGCSLWWSRSTIFKALQFSCGWCRWVVSCGNQMWMDGKSPISMEVYSWAITVI